MAGFRTDDSNEVMSEINMVPFIDVMLVLLIVFIVTVPMMKHAVSVDLPRASSEKELLKPETLRLSVQADGGYLLGDAPVADAALPGLLQAEAAKTPQPDLHIQGDKAVRYERVAQLLAMAQQAGLRKVGFVTEPARAP
jgi:biopolymer transport protein ExbD